MQEKMHFASLYLLLMINLSSKLTSQPRYILTTGIYLCLSICVSLCRHFIPLSVVKWLNLQLSLCWKKHSHALLLIKLGKGLSFTDLLFICNQNSTLWNSLRTISLEMVLNMNQQFHGNHQHFKSSIEPPCPEAVNLQIAGPGNNNRVLAWCPACKLKGIVCIWNMNTGFDRLNTQERLHN